MTTQGNFYGVDAAGNEALYSSLGQQVMMQWEQRYMQLAVEALRIRPTDRVLEIGFGLGYSATHIQTFGPRSHSVIECDRETLQRLQHFAATHHNVEIVAGTWQQTLQTLGTFDCIFFDDYPLPELSDQAEDSSSSNRSRWHEFLDIALKHCNKGARISGYLAREVDLQRPGCRVEVTKVSANVSEQCNYFPHKTALVPVITVVDTAAAVAAAAVGRRVLPNPSKRFVRAFNNAEQMGEPRTRFTAERGQMDEIRGFLLAHEMETLSYGDDGDIAEDGAQSLHGNDGNWEGGKSEYYSDNQSRKEFLRGLRSNAASAKRSVTATKST